MHLKRGACHISGSSDDNYDNSNDGNDNDDNGNIIKAKIISFLHKAVNDN